MRSMNACDAGAAITSSAKAANLLNASRLFCQKINASGVAFLSASSALTLDYRYQNYHEAMVQLRHQYFPLTA